MAYKLDGYRGVAWRRAKPTRDGVAFMTMIGDDRVFAVPADEVHRIRDDDYCAECGQIGCCHDGRDREQKR